MKKDIPHIEFSSTNNKIDGFEVVPIERIAQFKNEFEVDPEKPHQLSFYNLMFFTEGKTRHLVDFNWYPVEKNSLIYLTKDQITAFQFSKTVKGICLVFTQEFLVKSFPHLPDDFVFRLFNPELFSPILQIPEESEFEFYLDLLLKEYDNVNSFNQNKIVESLFSILLSKTEEINDSSTVLSKEKAINTTFQKFIELLQNNFSKSRNALFYSNELAISYKHLNEICKELTNKTVKKIIFDYVLLQAKRSLINSEIKSTELAYKLGFDDPTNFTKFFKKGTGITPKAFKKLYQ